MVAEKESQIVIPLNEGIVEDYVDELLQGATTQSLNTRLTTNKGTLTRRPFAVLLGSAAGASESCGGMAVGPGNSVVAYFKPKSGHKRMYDHAMHDLVSGIDATKNQNAWYPYEITDAGEAFTARGGVQPSVAIDDQGNRWMAVLGTKGNSYGIFVAVYNISGDLAAPEQFVATPAGGGSFPANLYLWKGLTTTALPGEVVLWYATSGSIVATRLSLVSSVVTVTAGPTTVAFPLLNSTGGIDADVCSDGAGSHYLLTRSATVATEAVLLKFSDALANTGTVVLTGAISAASGASLACSFSHISTVDRVFVAISDSAGANVLHGVFDSSLAVIASNAYPTTDFHRVAIQPYVNGGTVATCVAMSRLASSFATTDPTYCRFVFYDATSGTFLDETIHYWVICSGKGANHVVGELEIYPYFPLVPYWYASLGGYSPAVGNYVVDPSVELVSPSGVDNMTVVARYGVDRAANYIEPSMVSNDLACRNGELLCAYKYQNQARAGLGQYGDTSNWVLIDLDPLHQPSTAQDAGASSTVAGAYPVVWDGQETADVTVPHAPKLLRSAFAGTGASLTGVYSFRAVYSWRDKAGNEHRSTPSLPLTLTLAAEKPQIEVTEPLLFRNGNTQDYPDITLYMTTDGGSIFYAVSALPTGGAPTAGFYVFGAIPAVDTTQARLYSTGADNEPLLSTCPPPAWDIATIGSRQWIIDAEFRNRLLPSKLKEDGVAFEFDPTLAINTDRQYGKLIKVVDIGGRPFALAERGIWAIGGYGPDNAGQGSGFSEPQLVLNTGCKYRHTVVQIHGVGVMFQAEDGKFAMFTGSSLERFERFNSYEVFSPVVFQNEEEVVYPLQDGTGYVVYNYLVKGWTRWVQSVGTAVQTTTAQVPVSDGSAQAYIYDKTGGNLYTTNSASVSTNAPLAVLRTWMAPESPQGDCVFREMWLQLKYPEAWRHGITMFAAFNFDESDVLTRTWTAVELDALRVDGKVTIGMNLHGKSSRAIKVGFLDINYPPTEEDGDGATDYMQPIHATITYAASNGPRRRTLRAGALK